MAEGRGWEKENYRGQIYKDKNGIWIGTVTVSKEFDAEQSHPLKVEEARLYRLWKSKRWGDQKEKNGFGIIIAETRGHVLLP
jgi:hypothetical protein